MKDSPAQLRSDLLEHLFVPIASVQQMSRAGSRTAAPSQTPSPPDDHRPEASDENVNHWFTARMAAWPDHEPAPSEEADWAAFGDHFGRYAVSRETFRALRRKHTPPEWRKQGQRRPWGEVRPKI
jgi:hypothetical protein